MTSATQTRAAGASLFDRAAGFGAAAMQYLGQRRVYATTLSELQQLNDRDLADLGIHRAQIRDIAREAAYGRR